MTSLAERINAVSFDTVFEIKDGNVIERNDIFAPCVYNDDDDNDVNVDSTEWNCYTGMTNQYGYNGAVMHPSEFIGAAIAEILQGDSGDNIFAITEVMDMDDSDSLIGWTIVYKRK